MLCQDRRVQLCRLCTAQPQWRHSIIVYVNGTLSQGCAVHSHSWRLCWKCKNLTTKQKKEHSFQKKSLTTLLLKSGYFPNLMKKMKKQLRKITWSQHTQFAWNQKTEIAKRKTVIGVFQQWRKKRLFLSIYKGVRYLQFLSRKTLPSLLHSSTLWFIEPSSVRLGSLRPTSLRKPIKTRL